MGTEYRNALRIGLQFMILLLSFFRIDIPVLPMGLESYDAGFAGFVATMYMYEKHAGPIMTEFIDSMCSPVLPFRGVQHLRRDIDSGRLRNPTRETLAKLAAAEAALSSD